MNRRANQPVPVAKRFAAVAAAWLAVFIGGYGVMSAFWYLHYSKTYTCAECDRPFTYFISATWGDGLFLPAMIASMVAYLMFGAASTPTVTRLWVERTSWILAAIGGLAGAMVQLSWVTSDATVLNWTIPALHHFNSPGWYHACFFIVMFGAGAYFITRIFLERISASAHERTQPGLANLSYSLIWFGIAGFAFMRLQEQPRIDFLDYDFDFLTDAPAAIIAIVIAGILYSWLATVIAAWVNRNRRDHASASPALPREARSIFAGTLLAYAASLLIGGHPQPTFAITLAFYCMGLIIPAPQRRVEIAYIAYLLAAAGLGVGSWMVVAISSNAPITAANAVSLVAVVVIGFCLIVWMAAGQNLDSAPNALRLRRSMILRGMGLISIILMYRFSIDHLIKTDAIQRDWKNIVFQQLLPFALLFSAEYVVWIWNNFVKTGDHAQWTTREHETHAMQTKNIAWVSLICVFLGFMTILFFDYVPKVFANARVTMRIADFERVYFLLSFILAAVVFLAACLKFRRRPFWKWLSLLVIAALYFLAVSLIAEFQGPGRYNWHTIFALPPIIFGSVFIGNGIIGNMLLLRGRNPDLFSTLLAVLVGAGTACIFGATVFMLESLAAGVIPCIIVVLISLMAAGMIQGSSSDDKNMVMWDTAGALHGVLQDSLFGSIMVAISGLLVVSFLESDQAYIVLLILFAFGARGYKHVIRVTLNNNYHHLIGKDGYKTSVRFAEERKKAAHDPGRLKQIICQQHNFKYHLERQAWLVVLTLFPWTLWFLAEAVPIALRRYENRDAPRQTSFREMLGSYLYDHYLIETSILAGTHSRQLNRELGIDTGFAGTRSWLHNITHYPA